MSTSIDPPLVEITPEHAVDVATTATEVVSAKDLEVSAHKKEYSIVGDALFATVSADDAPTWLTDILSTVIGNGLDLALGDLNSARLDLSSALSSMHVAKNEFVEAINTQADEFGVLVSRIESQNASLNTAVSQVSADISSLQTTAVTPTEASALAADQIAASLNTPGHALHGAVSDVSSVVTSVADLGDSVGGFLDALGTVEENLAISFAQKITEVEAQVSGVTVGSRNLIPKTSEEEDGPDYEFFAYRDMAPTFEEYGLIEYTIGVDLKSPVPGNVNIYAQNGNGTRYSIGTKSCDVTTEWKRFTYTFTPTESDMTQAKAMVAFFGTYNTGRNIKLRRFKLERGNRASDWTPAPEDVSQAAVDAADAAELAAKNYADSTFVTSLSYAQDVEAIQNQLDTSITTWFMVGVPSSVTLPESEWNTPELKELHVGDLYYDEGDNGDGTPGFVYRYKKTGPKEFGWVKIEDKAVYDAMKAAANAQDTADSKRRVFYTDKDTLPTPPYDKGDLWDTGEGLLRAIANKGKDSVPSKDHWQSVADAAGAAADVYAKTKQTMTSFAAFDSAGNPITTAEFGLELTTGVNGEMVIGSFDMTNNGSTTSAAFDVDKFKIGKADASGVSPFEIVDGVTSIKSAFIKDLDIGKLTMDGNTVVSTVDGVSKIKADYLEVEDVNVSGILDGTYGDFSGGLNVGGNTGARINITKDTFKMYDGTNNFARVIIGKLS